MRIMVIGGTGFIGRYIVRNLAHKGHRVVCAGRTSQKGVLPGFADQAEGFARFDVSRLEEVIEAFQTWKTECVVNLAYQLGPLCDARPYQASYINILGFNNVLEAARIAGVERVVYASSAAYHGLQEYYGERFFAEDDLMGPPALAYGAAKIYNEFVALRYWQNFSIKTVGLRISNVYGHGRRGGVWSSEFASGPALGRPVTIDYGPEEKGCFIYVEDTAEMFARLCLEEPKHPVYLSGGHIISLGNLTAKVREILPDAEITFSEKARTLPFAFKVDSSRIDGEFGNLRRPLEEGLLEHIREARLQSGRDV